MSYYFNSIPHNIAIMLKEKYRLDMFVETGTYSGLSSEWASKHFLQVHTVEKNQEYYSLADSRLLNLPNVTRYLNDSRLALPEIMYNVGNYGTLFFLDAHWSKSANYGRPKIDSVAVDEILLINQWGNKNHAIIVDDAHRFGTERWPTKFAIIDALWNDGARYVRELLDVFIAVPERSCYESIDATATEFIWERGKRN